MDYSITAKQIVQAVGGEKNVAGLTHCMTRLRFNLKDTSNIDLKAIEKIPGVMGVTNKAGQLQIIIGNNVAKCYAEILKLGNFNEGGGGGAKQNPLVVVLDFIAGCMTPLIPAILAGGLIKVLIVILGPTLLNVLAPESQTFAILSVFGDAMFYFMPIMLAWSAARKLNTNIALAMALGGVLLHPNLIALLGSGEPVKFLGLPVYPGSYASSVIPILLSVILLKYVEILVDKITPEWSKNFLKPLLTFLITAPIALLALAPLGQMLGDGLSWAMTAIYNIFPPVAMALFGAFMPFIVMAGMHYAFMPATMGSMATLGYDIMLLPAMFCSNVAQAAATLAVAIKSKKSEIRQVSGSSSISAFLAGVTEPAMYGVTLKYKTPMIAACIGGGVAGFFMGLFQTKAYAFAVPSLISVIGLIPTNDSATMSNFYLGIVCVAISIVVTFVLTLILYKDPVEETGEGAAAAGGAAGSVSVTSQPLTIGSPLQGNVLSITQVKDPTFSTGVLGKGCAIVPTKGEVVAPFDGQVDNIFETGHAVGLVSDDGVELLIHVGLETVALKGQHFSAKVKSGDRVSKGQVLITFEPEAIQQAGYDITTPVVITNSDAFADVASIAENSQADELQPILKLSH